MHRTQIYIDDQEWGILKSLALTKKKTVSALIRNAVTKAYFSNKKLNFLQSLQKITGIWADKKINTEKYVRSLRKGRRKNIYEHRP